MGIHIDSTLGLGGGFGFRLRFTNDLPEAFFTRALASSAALPSITSRFKKSEFKINSISSVSTLIPGDTLCKLPTN